MDKKETNKMTKNPKITKGEHMEEKKEGVENIRDKSCSEIVFDVLSAYCNATGSTCILKEQLIDRALAKVFPQGGASTEDRRFIEAGVGQPEIHTLEFDGKEYCYTKANFANEKWMIYYLKEAVFSPKRLKLNRDAIQKAAKPAARRKGISLSAEQRAAIVKALTSGVAIISGGPGCGKTLLADILVKVVMKLKKKAVVRLAASTGKAARRLEEATQMPVQTVHRLLDICYEGMLENPSPVSTVSADLLIIDEASMLDLSVANRLFTMVAPSTSIILIGDPNQLPSVRPGAVLRDLMQSGVIPVAQLTSSFRQVSDAKDIMSVANAVNAAATTRVKMLPFPPRDRLCGPVSFLQADSPEATFDILISTVKRLHTDFGCPYSKIQVLSPMKDGVVGTNALNIELGKIINPKRCDKRPFAVGDRVVCTENDNKKSVVNGEIGEVVSVEMRHITVKFGFRNVEMSPSKIMLSYALTVHKAQGSEYPVVVLALHKGMNRALSRAMLYTAISRAKEKIVVIGSVEAIMKAISADRSAERLTLLARRLRDSVLKKLAEAV